MVINCHCDVVKSCSNYETSKCIQCKRNKDGYLNKTYDEALPYNDPDNYREKLRKNKNDFEIFAKL